MIRGAFLWQNSITAKIRPERSRAFFCGVVEGGVLSLSKGHFLIFLVTFLAGHVPPFQLSNFIFPPRSRHRRCPSTWQSLCPVACPPGIRACAPLQFICRKGCCH